MNNPNAKYDLSHLVPGKLYKVVEEEYCDFFLWTQHNAQHNNGVNVLIGEILMLIKLSKAYRKGYIKSSWLYKEHYGFIIFHFDSERARQLSCYKLMS